MDRLVIHQGTLGYADGMKDLDLQARIDTIEPMAATSPAAGASASSAADSGDAADAHVTGNFSCIGTPGSDHLLAGANKKARYRPGFYKLCFTQKPFKFTFVGHTQFK